MIHKKLFGLLVLLMTVVTGAWADPTLGVRVKVTWDEATINEIGIGDMEPGDSYFDDIFGVRVKIPRGGRITGGNITMNRDNQIDFSASENNLIAGIEITCTSMGEESTFSYGWTKTGDGKLTWDGSPKQVVTLSSSADDNFVNGITKIEFTLVTGFALTVGENQHGTVTFKVNGNDVTAANEGDKIMMEITPDEGWSTGSAAGQWYAAGTATKAPRTRRAPANIDLLKDFELTPVSGNPNAFTFTMERANAEVSINYKKQMNHPDITIEDIADQTYTGQPLEPAVVVKDGSTVLVKGTDYDVVYLDNTVAATATSDKAPAVIITACETSEKYSGGNSKTFTILPKSATSADITAAQDPSEQLIYNSAAQTPTIAVKDGEAVLAKGTDYTMTYVGVAPTEYAESATAPTAAGTYKAIITMTGNYTGTKEVEFTISPAKVTGVTLAQTEFMYNFDEPQPQTAQIAEVKAGNLIVPADQYDVEGNTQTEPGEYTVTVTGKINFTGTMTAKFVIKDTEVNGDAEKTETGEEVSDVKMTVSVVDRTQKTLSIDKFTKSSATSEGISIEIPAQINGWDVVNIGAGAMDGLANVTDIYMPDTEKPIEIGAGALPGLAIIHTSLALLDDYALMASLKQNYEATKVLTTVTPANKYWTLGVGCDVIIPDGIDVYTVQAKNTAEVATEIIPEDLLKNGSERIIKSNNGVLLLGEAGQSYDLWAYSGRLASGMPVSTADNKDYGRSNCLEPVVEKKHYDSGHYFVLKNNEFHSILAEGNEVKVPAGRAVLHLGNDQAGARSQILRIDSEATGLKAIENGELRIENWFDLNGRKIAAPTKKGIYILNGRKVVVK